jgi:hypothetical protein
MATETLFGSIRWGHHCAALNLFRNFKRSKYVSDPRAGSWAGSFRTADRPNLEFDTVKLHTFCFHWTRFSIHLCTFYLHNLCNIALPRASCNQTRSTESYLNVQALIPGPSIVWRAIKEARDRLYCINWAETTQETVTVPYSVTCATI